MCKFPAGSQGKSGNFFYKGALWPSAPFNPFLWKNFDRRWRSMCLQHLRSLGLKMEKTTKIAWGGSGTLPGWQPHFFKTKGTSFGQHECVCKFSARSTTVVIRPLDDPWCAKSVVADLAAISTGAFRPPPPGLGVTGDAGVGDGPIRYPAHAFLLAHHWHI